MSAETGITEVLVDLTRRVCALERKVIQPIPPSLITSRDVQEWSNYANRTKIKADCLFESREAFLAGRCSKTDEIAELVNKCRVILEGSVAERAWDDLRLAVGLDP